MIEVYSSCVHIIWIQYLVARDAIPSIYQTKYIHMMMTGRDNNTINFTNNTNNPVIKLFSAQTT